MLPDYVELHAVSAFSFQRGASLPQELVATAAALGYAGLALTDECSMAGMVRAWQQTRETPLPLIVGSELPLEDGPRLVALAQDASGYAQLCAAITTARRRPDRGHRLLRADLDSALPGCSLLWLPGTPDQDRAALDWLQPRAAGRLWIAAELHREGGDAARLARLAALGRARDLPLVASGDVHMHRRGRRVLQDVLTALRHHRAVADCGTRLFANGERHLRSRAELAELYPPALLRETLAVAERCAFRIDGIRYEYPRELVPAGHTPTSWLRHCVEQHLPKHWPQGCPPEVRATLERELALIARKAYEPFFLTVYDIVQWARAQNILCQGRGSAANSAVCYVLGITAVKPGFTELLFERFLSEERDEPPDIDVDFEHQRREEVIQYIYNKYGRERAAIAATVIRYQPRSALRDVGRALGVDRELVDRAAKSLAWWDDRAQLVARVQALGVDTGTRTIRLWLRLADTLLGFPRHLSQHVGGFVIADAPLAQLVPVENAAMPDRTIIQWDKDDLEALGLLKVDVLALGMLSALRRTLDLVQRHQQRHYTLDTIPGDDGDTYDMICAARTVGVFQIESRAQMSMLPRLQPRSLYDLTVQVAIVRPGPIEGGMVHPYLRRRTGQEPVEYPPGLGAVLGRTYGVPIFQEQVMRIAVVAAGFTPGEADQLRRAMAAWKRGGGLEKYEARLKTGMHARGYSTEFAERIYKQILGFGSYGFPESHAASFALLVYASAWLKCHHPAAFFCGLINAQPMGFYPVSMLVAEARRSGVAVRPIDIHSSGWDCDLEPGVEVEGDAASPALRLGLRLVEGFTAAAAQRVVAARAAAAFRDVVDLGRRAALSRQELDRLAAADALQALSGHRHQARWAARGVQRHEALLAEAAPADVPIALPEPGAGEEILADYRSTGLSLRAHPVSLLRPRLDTARVTRNARLAEQGDGRRVRVAGLVMFRQRPGTAKGTLFMTLEDETGIVNLIVWPALIEPARAAILGSRFLIVQGRLQHQHQVTHVIAERFFDRSHWLADLPALSRDFH